MKNNHIYKKHNHTWAQPGGGLRWLKPLALARSKLRKKLALARSKIKKKISVLNFWLISCIQPDQNVTTTLSYPSSDLILSHILAREGAIFVKILDVFGFFASW